MVDHGANRPAEPKPRFFYGYIVVIMAFFIMVVSWALYNAFGVFFTPLLEEFGWTRAETSGAFSLSMIIYGVLGIVVGAVGDRFGPRIVLTVCGILMGIGYLLMSKVNSLWQIYLFYGVIIGVGMSGVWVPQLSAVARWFIKRRTLMSGVILAGASVGSLIGPPIASRMIAAFDWRQSYLTLGIVVFITVVVAAQFLRRDPTQMGQRPYGEDEVKHPELKPDDRIFTLKTAAATPQFWIAFGMLFCFGFGSFSIIVHIVPHAIWLGIPAIAAANILAFRGGIGILGNFFLGNAADKIGNRRTFIIGFILVVLAFLWLIPAEKLWMLYVFMAVFAFACGGMGASESPITAWLFGLRSHGLIYGVVHLGFTVGAAVGPVITGYVFDLTESYRLAFMVCVAVAVAGIALSAILRPTTPPAKPPLLPQ